MFDINKELQVAINKTYEAVHDHEHGATFTWDELRAFTGLRSASKEKMYYIANKVCLMLMRHDSKYFDTIPGKGKRIILAEEHGVIAKKTVNKSVRIYRKAGAILASTDMDKLSEDQKRDVIEKANKYATLELFAKEVLKTKKIGKNTPDQIEKAGLFLDTIKLFAKA